VDDDRECRELCASVCRDAGLTCVEAESAEAALLHAGREHFDMVLTDLLMENMTGLALLVEIKRAQPEIEVALMSAYGSIESAVEAMRLGAFDFLVKPVGVEKLKAALRAMAERVLARNEKSGSAETAPGAHSCTDLEELERLTVRRVFELVKGDKEQAQKLLGISRATLYRKIKRYGITTGGEQAEAGRDMAGGERTRAVYVSHG
jgi:DNA-binding NtrC family response regulator